MASAPFLTLPLTTIRGVSTIEQSRIEARYEGRTIKYLAEIAGTDLKFGFARRFLKRVATRTHEGNHYSIYGIDKGTLIEFGFEDKGKRYGVTDSITSSKITFSEIASRDAFAIALMMDSPGGDPARDPAGTVEDVEESLSTSEIVANIFDDVKDDPPEDPDRCIVQAEDIDSFRDKFKRRIS